MFGFVGVGVSGCAKKPSKADCEQLLTKMYDMDVQSSGVTKVTEAQKKAVDKQIKDVKKDLRKKFMTQCLDRTPKAWVKCALNAKDKKAIEDCKGS